MCESIVRKAEANGTHTQTYPTPPHPCPAPCHRHLPSVSSRQAGVTCADARKGGAFVRCASGHCTHAAEPPRPPVAAATGAGECRSSVRLALLHDVAQLPPRQRSAAFVVEPQGHAAGLSCAQVDAPQLGRRERDMRNKAAAQTAKAQDQVRRGITRSARRHTQRAHSRTRGTAAAEHGPRGVAAFERPPCTA